MNTKKKSQAKEKKILRIAIQGAKGSFHELAAKKHFSEDLECLECNSFKDVFSRVANGEADFGITAIENTVAGTILPNYAMLRNAEARIIGEVYLHIQQNLLALPGQTIQDIQEVHSHPMAILQCQNYFEKHPHIKLIEADDTAASARWISEKKLNGFGAIAGLHVAELYKMDVLATSIETHKKNFTRFLVIERSTSHAERGTEKTVPDKSSICFNVAHKKGSLASILSELAEYDINLTKIQSLPLLGKEWEYYIHIDMEFDNYSRYQSALKKIMPSLNEFKILGEYKRGSKIFNN